MKLIIHGGFFSESGTNQEMKRAKQDALREIITLGHKYLQTHNAIETVVYTVSLLEDCDLFNAGTGSQIQGSDGKIRNRSESMMNGKTMQFSGVINIEGVRNPIRVAERLLSKEDAGAVTAETARALLNLPLRQGFALYNPETPQRRQEYEKEIERDSISV